VLTARRMTVQRRAVLDALLSHANHPTADEIYDAVRKRLPRISLSTVYRNLGILIEQGEIIEVHGPCSELHYDHITHDHCHVRCSLCGRVCDVHVSPIDVQTVLPEVASGFNIENVHITFTGVCPSCQKENQEERE
jgi:Fur family ferric uptake transcriptional regulator